MERRPSPSPERTSSQPSEKKKDSRPTPTRRGFLATLAVGALGLATENSGTARTLEQQPIKERLNGEYEKIIQAMDIQASHTLNKYYQGTPDAPRNFCPPEILNQVHDQLLATYGKDLNVWFGKVTTAIASDRSSSPSAPHMENPDDRFVRIIRQESFGGGLQKVCNDLKRYNLHGLFYHFLKTQGKTHLAERIISPEGINEWAEKFSLKTKDYLPFSTNIEPRDIDPIVGFHASPNYGYKKEERELILKNSKWADPTWQAGFKEYLDAPDLRNRLENEPGLSLAGAFSVIKATMEYKANFSPKETSVKTMERILKERRAFAKEILLDKKTSVIRLYGKMMEEKKESGVNMFDPAEFEETSKRLGVVPGKPFESNRGAKEAKKDFLETLEKSNGKTFALISSEGEREDYALDVENKVRLEAKELADSLFKRLLGASRDGLTAIKTTLGDLTLFSEACSNYDLLHQHLMPELKNNWSELIAEIKKFPKNSTKEFTFKGTAYTGTAAHTILALEKIPFNDISLPRAIALGQEGAVIHYGGFNLLLRKTYLEGRTSLTGADLLALDDDHYALGGDMTFSSRGPGNFHPISQNTEPLSVGIEDEAREKLS